MKLRTFFFWVVFIFALVIAWQTFVPKALPEFEAELWQIDTTSVTSVHWMNTAGEFTLVREGKKWLITHHTRTVAALPKTVEKLLTPLQSVPTQDPISVKIADWKKYGVDEATAIRGQVYDHDAILEDFWVSPLTEKDSLGMAKTYVRLAGQEEIFRVDGKLSQVFRMPFHQFRDATVLELDSLLEINTLEYFLQSDSSLFFAKAQHWQNDTVATVLDSSVVQSFLATLQTVHSTDFADRFDETRIPETFHRALELGIATQPTIRIECYQDSTWQMTFVLHSSQNPGTYFESDSTGLYQRFFGFFEQRLSSENQEL